jgi:hypothetical protein
MLLTEVFESLEEGRVLQQQKQADESATKVDYLKEKQGGYRSKVWTSPEEFPLSSSHSRVICRSDVLLEVSNPPPFPSVVISHPLLGLFS